MTLDEVKAITGLSEAQLAAAERWYKMPTNRGKQMQGTEAEIKEQLKKLVDNYNKHKESKQKKDDTFGTLKMVTDVVQDLVKEKKLFTYMQIVLALEVAADAAKAEQESIKELEAQLAAKKASLKEKKLKINFE